MAALSDLPEDDPATREAAIREASGIGISAEAAYSIMARSNFAFENVVGESPRRTAFIELERDGDTVRASWDGTTVDVEESRVISDVSEFLVGEPPTEGGASVEEIQADEQAERLSDVDLSASVGDVGTLVDAVRSAGGFDAERIFTSNAPGNREAGYSATVYESGDLENQVASVQFEDDVDAGIFADTVNDLSPDRIEDVLASVDGSEAIEDARDARDSRRETREAARDAAEAAGVDLDEFGIDARADGEVIVQDRDTGRTRTIDADAPGGVGSAIDAATGDGQFVADDADPAASGSGSGDGLGARAAGAIVLLFGALAAALGWLS